MDSYKIISSFPGLFSGFWRIGSSARHKRRGSNQVKNPDKGAIITES